MGLTRIAFWVLGRAPSWGTYQELRAGYNLELALGPPQSVGRRNTIWEWLQGVLCPGQAAWVGWILRGILGCDKLLVG